MDKKVREQILKVRETALTNMFDTNAVQRIANEMGFFELVIFLEDNISEYVKFIIHGD